MKIIGCDFHPGYQQIAMLDLATGEMVEKALSHERKDEVRAFYAGLGGSVRVGIEAIGQSQWFERTLAELGHEVWIGDAAKIRASCERKQKTDRRDAELLLRLLAEARSFGEGCRRKYAELFDRKRPSRRNLDGGHADARYGVQTSVKDDAAGLRG